KDVLPYSIVVGNNKVINNRIAFNPPMQIDASNKENLPYFYRGFMQKNEEKINNNSFALYEEDAMVVLQKANCNKWIVQGTVEGNLNNNLVKITINNSLELEYKLSHSNFEIVCDISTAKKITNANNFLVEKYNTIHIKIVDYQFNQTNFITINKIIQSL
ncbi:MAG: hypothetical protein NTZ59_15295, partial [Bacteroidetes bacterium]|nr:hypothetical protein [Bacteroidota bacterium]